jgi:hypothetical protein
MQREELDPVASHLIASYMETASYSRQFRDDHDTPPTLMAKVHHLRSIVQALLVADDDYELAQPYADFGRVEFTETSSGGRFLLKSAGALAVEKKHEQRWLSLFAVGNLLRPSDVQVLIYEFDKVGLTLSLADAVRHGAGKKLRVHGEMTTIGFWPYHPDDGDDDGGVAAPFDQDDRDPFGDVGGLDEGNEGEGGAK